jgi:hypothetical protein
VLAEEGKAKAIAFDEIDKAPEENKRGITIATVGMTCPPLPSPPLPLPYFLHAFHILNSFFYNTLLGATFIILDMPSMDYYFCGLAFSF